MEAFADVVRVTVRDVELPYREAGEGDPVVLVHGTASDMRSWGDQLPVLGRSFRTIAYSRRFSPPGPPIPEGTDDQMLVHVEDLIALLPAVEATPAHLVGHSWGGFITLLVAARRPDLVRSLVLIEPPAMTLFTSAKPKPGEILRLLATRPRTGVALIRFGAGTISRAERCFRRGEDERALEIFGSAVLGREQYRDLSEERRREFVENIPTTRAQLLGEGFPPLEEEQVRSTQAPALLVSGSDSPPFFHCILERIGELLPDARAVEIAGAAHAPQWQQPAAFNTAVLDFLSGTARRAG